MRNVKTNKIGKQILSIPSLNIYTKAIWKVTTDHFNKKA